MSKQDMLFIFPKYEDVFNNFIGTGYHIGSAYIRAYLAERGVETGQYIGGASVTLEGLVDDILRVDTPVVGFTCYDKSYYINKQISVELKRRRPDLKIVFGGPTPSFSDEFVMEHNPAVDVCVREEGEVTMLELVNCWKAGKGIDDVAGITFRRDGEVVRNPDRPQLTSGEKDRELDFLPSPYLSGMLPVDPQTAGVVSARGCPFKCTFCNNSIMGRQKIRRHSTERILAELEYISRHGGAGGADKKINVTFVDDAMTLDVARAKRVCRGIVEKNFSNLRFGCQTRIDRADDELFTLFVEAGFYEVSFGLDTASPRVLNKIKKVRTVDGAADNYVKEREFLEQYRKNIRLAQDKGLRTYVSLIFGLPTETPVEARESLDFVREIKADYYSHNILKVFTGTEISRTIDRYGIKKRVGPFYLPYVVDHSYDVWEVPHLENSMSQSINIVENYKDHDNYSKAMGVYEQKSETEMPRQIVFDRVRELSDRTGRWLAKTAALDTFVCFVNDGTTPEEYEARLRSVSKNGVPLVKYVQVRQSEEAEAFYKLNDFMPEFRQGGYYTYHNEPFAQAGAGEKNDKIVRVRQVNRREDFEVVIAGMDASIDGGSLDFDELTGGHYLIEDKCRWSQCGCHAPGLKRLMVDENENVRPCVNAKAIGTTAEGIDVIRERVKRIAAETRERRGCDACEARFECSRCIFLPDYLEEEEYCALRKRNRKLHKAVEAVEMARRLMLQMKNKRIQQAGEGQIELQVSGLNGNFFDAEEPYSESPDSPQLEKGFVLLKLGRSYFLYNIMQTRLLRINDRMAAVFEILENRAYDPAETPARLSRQFSILPHDAETLLKQALEMFRQAKIVAGGVSSRPQL